MTVGERIKEQRRNYGLTQKQLAEKMGVAEITIRQYELGKRVPSLDVLQKIADAIEIPIRDLIPPKTITFNATPDPEYAALEKKLEDGTITQNELQRYKELVAQGAANAHKAISAAMERLAGYMDTLNDSGQQKVIERAEELTEIPKYRRQDPQVSSQPQQKGKDTVPTENPPETPQEPPEGK